PQVPETSALKGWPRPVGPPMVALPVRKSAMYGIDSQDEPPSGTGSLSEFLTSLVVLASSEQSCVGPGFEFRVTQLGPATLGPLPAPRFLSPVVYQPWPVNPTGPSGTWAVN